MNKKTALVMVLSALMISAGAHAQHDFDSLYKNSAEFKQSFKEEYVDFNLFDQENILDISIESDFKNLIRTKQQGAYQPAVLRTNYNDTVTITRKIEIKARGNFRRSNCLYPPLKMNFPSKKVKIKQLREFDKMKMVVECKNQSIYQQYLIGEYLAYRIYNILTDYSFRVRMLRVHYTDLSDKYKPDTRYAFLIEDIGELTKRTNSIEITTQKLGDNSMDREINDPMMVFQYLIGNTDFSVPGRHNMKIAKPTDHMAVKAIPIPYDFDYSGIVNASYAIPADVLNIESVRQRLFRGHCRTKEEFEKAFDLFREKKDEIYALYQSSELLDPKYVKNTISYLDDFYKAINSPGLVKAEFLNRCR